MYRLLPGHHPGSTQWAIYSDGTFVPRGQDHGLEHHPTHAADGFGARHPPLGHEKRDHDGPDRRGYSPSRNREQIGVGVKDYVRRVVSSVFRLAA